MFQLSWLFLILGGPAKSVIALEVQRIRRWSLCGCVWFRCVNVTCQSRVGKDTHSGIHTCRHTYTLTFREINIRFHHRSLQHCAPIPVSSLQSNLPGPRTQSQIPSEAFPFKHVRWNVPTSTTLIQNCTSLQRKELKWTLKNDTSQKFDLVGSHPIGRCEHRKKTRRKEASQREREQEEGGGWERVMEGRMVEIYYITIWNCQKEKFKSQCDSQRRIWLSVSIKLYLWNRFCVLESSTS